MPRIFLPPELRPLCDGLTEIEVEGTTVRAAVDRLESRFPGARARLCDDSGLRPDLSVTVDGGVSSRGLLHPLDPGSEVHFLPAIGGG